MESSKQLNNNTKRVVTPLPSEHVKDILYSLGMDIYGAVVVSLPLGSLLFCFVTAFIFQHKAVTETECHVSRLLVTLYLFPMFVCSLFC